LVARHEILRTLFHRLPGRSWPAQVVLDEEWRPRIELLDLSGREGEVRTAALEGLWEEMLDRPFAPDREPPLTVALVRLAAREHVLVVGAHALCADAAALEILVRDLRQAYAARLGLGGPGSEEPAQYADVAEGLNELLEAEETDAGRELWREMRAGHAVRELPFEREPDPGGRTAFRPRVVGAAIGRETLERAEELAGAASCPLSVVLLAAWQVLLHRLTAAEGEPWTLGVDFEGRHYEGFDTALGLFVRTLPLPVAVREEGPFRALLARLDQQVEALYDWQEYFSWERLPEGERGGFFAAGFGFEEPREAAESAGGVSFSQERTYACVERFRLKLVCRRQQEGLRIELHFDASRFAEEDVRRLLDAFRALLANAVAAPDSRVDELDLIDAAEHRRLAAAHEATARRFEPVPVHHLIREQAGRTPGAVALSTDDDRLTYRELAERARRLAGHLRRLGVRPDVRVGLCVERSVEMVVGILGILESGGVYVPVDPDHPAARQAFVLEDSKAAVLLTRPPLLAKLPPVNGGTRVAFLDEPETWSDTGEEAWPPPDPENAAYVLYTSGSTGVPKGVVVRHRALTNHMLWMREAYPLAADDRVLQKTPFGFDASVWELFLPLMMGAELVLAAPGAHREPALLARTLAARRITVLQVVPSLLRLLLEEEAFAGCASLTRVFCGGEALWGDLRDRFYGVLPGAQLVNLYGPTETTVQISSWVAERTVSERPEMAVPIGLPIHNARLYLLDRRLLPVPDGFLGEVWIGGEPPARGYLDRPGLTAASFLPDPFAAEPGGRMYRSGDLARRRQDGALEFVNRAGQQIKIRGNRFDPGEIEVILRTHPRVAEAVAMVREDQPGDERLVAYVVPRGEAHVAAELRALLAERVPEYMVPTSYVVLPTLPLTPNGKLDRAALPAPSEPSRSEADFAAPRSAVEEVLAQIWADLLGVERVGIHDNFFDLGGHSLLGTQLIYRVREAIGVELSLRGVFESPTVAGIAEQVEELWRVPQSAPIAPVPRNGEIPLSFAQQRLWFIDQLEPGSAVYNTPYFLRLTGELDVPALAAALAGIVERHEVLRTTFAAAEGGAAVQVIGLPFAPSLPLTDLGGLSQGSREAEARRLATLEAGRPFDLRSGPVLRTSLLRLANREHVLLVNAHHIATDAWSMEILWREVSVLYEGFRQGRPAVLPALPIQYADFAVWQRGWFQGEVLESQLAYWRRRLGDDPPVVELPADRARPAVQSYRGADLPLTLPAAASTGLHSLSRRAGATPFMTLLALFVALLGRMTGQRDLPVGTPISGRRQPEVGGLVGFFLNTLVIRAELPEGATFRELVAQVRTLALEAYAHQDVPFEKLVDELGPRRSLSHSPLFQV
ncbi:MAG TPA: amino acid adenylation domain-containing protein, partial [Thermoanaerobaculia bacterium]|nr:amino acid adenylation domain-containing protein [Thermoanaerobaculia bacterium]